MGVIDEKAKFGGSLKPMLWWRYRDDIFDIWTQGLPKLLEFTDYIYGLYPTIKFELVYSDSHLNVLDLTLHFRDGFISTDVYAKPTNSYLYLIFFEFTLRTLQKSSPLRGSFKNQTQLFYWRLFTK